MGGASSSLSFERKFEEIKLISPYWGKEEMAATPKAEKMKVIFSGEEMFCCTQEKKRDAESGMCDKIIFTGLLRRKGSCYETRTRRRSKTDIVQTTNDEAALLRKGCHKRVEALRLSAKAREKVVSGERTKRHAQRRTGKIFYEEKDSRNDELGGVSLLNTEWEGQPPDCREKGKEKSDRYLSLARRGRRSCGGGGFERGERRDRFRLCLPDGGGGE